MSEATEEESLPPCICGHQAHEHHTSWFSGGAMIIEECEDWDHPECVCQHYRRGSVRADTAQKNAP